MPTIIIRTVEITETNFLLSIEFDFALEEGGSHYVYPISVSKPEYLYWKESVDPQANTLDDYIITLVRPHYEKLFTQKQLADQLNLVDKSLSW